MAERAPSLLTPGIPARPLLRPDRLALAGLWAAAVAARLAMAGSHPYTAEAAHYAIARDLWRGTPGALNLYNSWHLDFEFLFWQRPLFSLLLAPGALVSFTAYRALHVALASLLPALATSLLLSLGARRWLAWPAGLVLAVHPLIVPWGTLVLPDSLMAVLTLSGLLAAHHGRPLASGVLFLAACWTKEVGLVTVLALLALALWRDPEGVKARAWPLGLGRFATALGAAAALAFVPLLFSLSRPGAMFPGWGTGGEGDVLVERLFLNVWLVPLVVLALRFPASRRLAVVSLAWSGFFLAYHFVLGRAVEAWYIVLPGSLSLMAAAAGLSAAWDAWPAPRRVGVAVAAGLVAVLLGLQVAAPDTDDAKLAVVTPFSEGGQWSLQQAVAYEGVREDMLHEAVARLTSTDQRLLAIDVDWSFVLYPLMEKVDTVYSQDSSWTLVWRLDMGVVSDGIENRTDAVLVHKQDNAFNRGVRTTYADCVVFENEQYALLRGAGCVGRGQTLADAVATGS